MKVCFLTALLLAQTALFAVGWSQLADGQVVAGVFNITVNLLFGALNAHTIFTS